MLLTGIKSFFFKKYRSVSVLQKQEIKILIKILLKLIAMNNADTLQYTHKTSNYFKYLWKFSTCQFRDKHELLQFSKPHQNTYTTSYTI